VSRDLLIASCFVVWLVVVSFDEDALVELSAGSGERDEVGRVDGSSTFRVMGS